MSVFSAKMKKAVKKAAAWSMSALTALTCTAALPLVTNTAVTVNAAGGILDDAARGVIYANSRTDFRDESIYFLITTRFYDGDPSNNARTSEDTKAKNPESDPSWRGDFKGLIDKLDYIKALGFTAIWITPVVQNDSGYDYHGYHAYNFSAVDTRYESNGVTYQTLIDACHAKGIKVIQDVVFNHTCNWGEENLLKITDEVYGGGRSDYVMASGAAKDPENIYHHNGFCGGGDWDNFEAQRKTIADDCFDLNTENPKVYNYLIDCYNKYIEMGVDGFRVDTVKHISRLTQNSTFVPAFKKTGGDKFYMFGEVCTKGHDVWYRDAPPISCAFYTWAEDSSWLSKWTTDAATNEALTEEHYNAHLSTSSQPTSDNAFLKGNEYHTPDYSQRSGMDVIDFQMHWSFNSANGAFNTALGEDRYFNDSTWNVVYVDSHDYGPDEAQTMRYNGGEEAWAENMSLMFTFRGIPCIFYGSEIQFQAGKPIDVGPNAPLSETGRAYYGDNIEGTVQSSDFTVWAADGKVAETLAEPLSQHLMRLNRIRQAVPALRKGQYSTEGCSGNMAFKRRYTDSNTDSFACVAISGDATFSGIPNGTYVDAVTGDTKTVSGGTLSVSCSGKGNLRVYVLDTAKTPAPGRVIPNGKYLTDGGADSPITSTTINVVAPTGITLNKTSVSLLEGETASVSATVKPDNATNKGVTWTTSDASVATVSGGTIKGVGKGTATITAKTSNNLTATVSVTVKENTNIVKPTGVTITPATLSLTAGETGTLTATVAPSNATDKSVTWTSSNAAVATVSNGTVTAVAAGSATITATTSNGKTATATVSVEGKSMTYIENGVYFEKPSDWGNTINIYMYDGGSNTTIGSAWPGTAMKSDGNGVYYYEYTPTGNLTKVIFNDGGRQVPGANQPGFDFENRGYYTSAGFQYVVEKQNNVDVTSVTLNKTSASVEKGSTVTLSAAVAPSNATNKTITWNSSNTAVATVSGGVVTGVAKGTATITAASANGVSASATITVTDSGSTTALTNSASVSAASVKTGSTVTVKGAASGGTSPYQYAYYYKKSTASSFTTLKAYSTATSASFTPSAAGTYTVRVSVKDAQGTVKTKDMTVTVTSDTTTLTNKSTVSAASITLGKSVTVTGAASGGTSPYSYGVYYKKSSSSSYTTAQAYSTTKTVTITPGAATTYDIRVKVKDAKGTISTKDFTLKVTAGVLSNTSTLSASSVALGKSVTITGKATGGTAPYQYAAYYKKASSSSYTAVRGYSTAATMTLTPAAATTYDVRVKVKDSVGTVVSKDFTLKVTASALSNTSTVSATSVTLGKAVTITGKATGGTAPYQYSAWYKKTSSSTYTLIRDFKSTSTMTLTPAVATTYDLRVKVKDAKGTVKNKDFTIKVTASALANASTVSATSVALGKSVTITGKATGGTAPYQYSAWYKKTSSSTYTLIRDFKSTSTMTLTPAVATTYDLRVKVRDAKGTVKNKDFTIKVTASALANTSTISATSITLGKSVTVTAKATGGTAPYQYCAYYKKSSSTEYTKAYGFGTTTKMTIKPAVATTYDIRVKVKDAKGTIATKDFKVKVS